VHELGIHARTCAGKGLKHSRHFQREIGQHTGGGVGCFAPRLSAFYKQNGRAALAQRDGKRKPNDPTADDDDVPRLHVWIVKQRRGRPGGGRRRRVASGWLSFPRIEPKSDYFQPNPFGYAASLDHQLIIRGGLKNCRANLSNPDEEVGRRTTI
jgi:hypothetical protein